MTRLVTALLVGVLLLVGARVAHASSADALVQMAKAHESAHEDDVAVRRYMEALALDPTCDDAYLGLGAFRARMGDLAEAERVYSVALEHRPQLDRARTARAYVRRALGFRRDAAVDLLGAEPSPASLQVLAGWHEEDGQTPAELAVWRRLAVLAEASQDLTLQKEARRMIRALVILVGSADPAASPVDPIGPRKLVAVLTKTWWPAPASRR